MSQKIKQKDKEVETRGEGNNTGECLLCLHPALISPRDPSKHTRYLLQEPVRNKFLYFTFPSILLCLNLTNVNITKPQHSVRSPKSIQRFLKISDLFEFQIPAPISDSPFTSAPRDHSNVEFKLENLKNMFLNQNSVHVRLLLRKQSLSKGFRKVVRCVLFCCINANNLKRNTAVPPLSTVSSSMVPVTRGQRCSENITLKILGINNS